MDNPLPYGQMDGSQRADGWTTGFSATAEIGAQAWLAEIVQHADDISEAIVVFESEGGGSFVRLAAWPPGATELEHLRPVIDATMAGGTPQLLRDPDKDQFRLFALPLILDGHVAGIVAGRLEAPSIAAARGGVSKVELGLGWLIAHIREWRVRHDRRLWSRSAFALDLLAAISDETKPYKAALAAANALCRELAADRVSIGFVHDHRFGRSGRIKLVAMSNTAWFRAKSPQVLSLENAMEEALDQLSTVIYPEPPNAARAVAAGHATYAAVAHCRNVFSVIIARGGEPVGILTVERAADPGFSDGHVELAEASADLIGPFFHLNRKQWRFISGRFPDFFGKAVKAVFGAGYPSLKIGLLAAALLIGFSFFYSTTLRVSADAVLEGSEQRAAAMPFAGFIAAAEKRAGDVVKAGDVLLRLDDKDLRLENLRWVAEYSQLQQQKRKALVGEERADLAVLDAQIEQAKAQVQLSSAKLERTIVLAPIDGIVISGDWSQKLGTPVEKGEVLMQVAPLTDYRIILNIDERDISLVERGQVGTLLLAGRAEANFSFIVDLVTPVATAKDGVNAFRVEARPQQAMPAVRPGMGGVGKIGIGERTLAWIWTRRLVNWGQTFFWRWTP